MKTNIAIIIFIFLSISVFSQKSNEQKNIVNIDQILLKDDKSFENLRDLYFKIQPSIYFLNNKEITYGQNPKHLFIDLDSMQNILKDEKYESIEMVTIHLSSTKYLRQLDLAIFQYLKALKYIVISLDKNIIEGDLEDLNAIYASNYSLFYKFNNSDN